MNGYLSGSVLRGERQSRRLELATALARTPDGLLPHACFFSGFVDRPDVAAAGLLAVADVAASRYADVGLAQRLANLDPVVTAGGDRLRFESFSACNGVHARFDLLRDGLGTSEIGFGTTNVDVNPPLRTALAQVGRSEPLHLAVGREELRLSAPSGAHVERKVVLPDRWVRGFAEVGTLLASSTRVAELPGAAARRFFASLPRVEPPGPDLHVLPHPTGWRTSGRPLRGSVPLPGASRIRGADRVLRHVDHLSVHAHEHGTSAWVFAVPGGRLTLVTSPGPFRGFSGEGALLPLLADPQGVELGRRVLDELGWESVIDPQTIGASTGLSDSQVRAGLAWLAASGRVGFDLAEQAWFHRELPVDTDTVLSHNPRLVSARALVEAGAVVRRAGEGWHVGGSRGSTYAVTAEGRLRCTCPWEAKHEGTRGPCKHVLAVLVSLHGG